LFIEAALSRARPQAPHPLGWLGLRPTHPHGLLEIVVGKGKEGDGRARKSTFPEPSLIPESVRSSAEGKNERGRMTE